MKTQQEIENTVLDVIYDENEIYHVLEPNTEGVRGIPLNMRLIRDTLLVVKQNLSHLDQTKIKEWEEEELRDKNNTYTEYDEVN